MDTTPEPVTSSYPSDVTFHDLIAANKRNSILLMIGMGLLTIAVAEAVVMLVVLFSTGDVGDLTPRVYLIGLLAGLLVIIPASAWSYFSGSKTILRMSGAKPLKPGEDPQLDNIVEEMAIAAGLPKPKVYLIHTRALNAFATGRDPEHAAVAITTGLRKKLTRDELTGVIAHEIAHIRHYDIRMTMLVATLVGLIVMGSDAMTRSTIHRGHRRRRGNFRLRFGGSARGGGSRKGGGGAAAILIVLLLVFVFVIAPLLARLMQFAVSRQREYLADAGAVELTRYPPGLIGALRKLAADHTPLPTASRATAHLFIENPILNAEGKQELDSAFSTHPPISQRIRRLSALMR